MAFKFGPGCCCVFPCVEVQQCWCRLVDPASVVIAHGTNISGTVESLDEVYLAGQYVIAPDATCLDFYVEFSDIESGTQPVGLYSSGNYSPTATHTVSVSAWNWDTSAWDVLSLCAGDEIYGGNPFNSIWHFLPAHLSGGVIRARYYSVDNDTSYRLSLTNAYAMTRPELDEIQAELSGTYGATDLTGTYTLARVEYVAGGQVCGWAYEWSQGGVSWKLEVFHLQDTDGPRIWSWLSAGVLVVYMWKELLTYPTRECAYADFAISVQHYKAAGYSDATGPVVTRL